MREKILQIIADCVDEYYAQETASPEQITTEILTLIREEIEKVANPYPQLEPDLCRQNPTFMANADGFERCRQKILAQLK